MKIYIVHFDYALDWEDGHETLGAYRKRKDALARLKEKADEIRDEWDENEIDEDTETRFNAFPKGEYSVNHHTLWVEETELL